MLRSSSFSRGLGVNAAPLLAESDRIYTNLYGAEPASLAYALKRNDWSNTEEFISKGRQYIHGEVKTSELRGRGGAGFSTGTKWGFVPKASKKPHYLVINADEGEPGTCKDRQILTNEPQKLVEGCLLAGYTINAHKCYVYIRGEFRHEAMQLQKAIDEARTAGLIGEKNKFDWPFEIEIHRGAGAYVCGEETALLNSIEGKPGRPRSKPPFPAVSGLYKCPTIVNNVETISAIPTILRRGGKWYSSIGIPASKGTKLYSISGHVNHPCVVEDSLGVSLKELVEKHAGGVRGGWDNLLGVIPGGLSCPILTPDQAAEAVMGYKEMAAMGSSLGTGAIMILDKSTDLFQAFYRHSAFYRHESCGQCGPCREGTSIMADVMQKFVDRTATAEDLDYLERTAAETTNCICALAAASSDPIKGLLKHFRKEFIARIQ